MIDYHKNHEIDREQWDNCIKNAQVTQPYPYSWCLDIMAPGWEALVDDDYDSVFPIPAGSKFGVKYITTPAFLQQLGAFSPDKPVDNCLNEFLFYLPDFFKLVDLNISRKVVNSSFRITEKSNYRLDLSKPYEKLFENFSSGCRKNVETSQKKGFEITRDINPDEMINLFIQDRSGEAKGIRPRDYGRLKNLMTFCTKNKKGRILGVRGARKRLLFGIFVIEIKGGKTILFSVNSRESREKRINYFVINELIRESAGTRNVLDFAGSSLPAVATFLESFGAINVPYYRIYRNRLLWPVRMLK